MATKSKKSYAFDYAPIAVTTFNFPPEIEYVIFELAARTFPRDAATLSVLCRRVQPYVESIMYESLLIVPRSGSIGLDLALADSILPTLMSRPSTFFAAHVRNLCIRPEVSVDIARIVLSKCTAIQHLALTLNHHRYMPTLALTAHTLISLNVGKQVVEDLAQRGIVMPNLLFLALQFYRSDVRVPSLEWVPSVRTVLLELGRFPLSENPEWIQDMETILSTAPQLHTLKLNAYRSAMRDAKEYLKGRNMPKRVNIVLSSTFMEDEWRRLYRDIHPHLTLMAKKSKKSYAFDYAPIAVTTFNFPPEIEYVIFELAARTFPRDAATLSVLCRRVQPYIESIMYESLLIVPLSGSIGLDRALADSILPTLMSRPSTFFAAHVRNLCIRDGVSMDISRIVLSKCTAIRHLAIMLYNRRYMPTLTLTAHTLISLSVGKHVVEDLAQHGIVMPNLLFLALQFYRSDVRVPSLEWVPSVRTVLLELGRFPLHLHPGWIQDMETILSTVPQLHTLKLNAYRSAMHDAKEYLKGRNMPKRVNIVLSSTFMEEEWRRLHRGKGRF